MDKIKVKEDETEGNKEVNKFALVFMLPVPETRYNCTCIDCEMT